MNQRNCPNCAAPYDVQLNKCPYCGTSYYDMSGIDFEDGTPFYLKIKTNINGQPMYITQLVKPRLESIEVTSDSTYAYDILEQRFHNFVSNRGLTTNISFEGISDKNGELMTITIK